MKGDVMDKAFESIKQGLTAVIGHANGTQAGVKVWRPVAVAVADWDSHKRNSRHAVA